MIMLLIVILNMVQYFVIMIYIDDNCNKKNSCWIMNDGIHGYECHPEYKCSLFVNTAGPNKKKSFFSIGL